MSDKTENKEHQFFLDAMESESYDPKLSNEKSTAMDTASLVQRCRKNRNRLKNIEEAVEDTCDCHGLNRHTVTTKVHAFLCQSRQLGMRWVKIITGRGHHSPDGVGILAEVVRGLLRNRYRDDVEHVLTDEELPQLKGFFLVALKGNER